MRTSQVTDRVLTWSYTVRTFFLKRVDQLPRAMVSLAQVFMMVHFVGGWLFQSPPETLGLGRFYDVFTGFTFVFAGGAAILFFIRIYDDPRDLPPYWGDITSVPVACLTLMVMMGGYARWLIFYGAWLAFWGICIAYHSRESNNLRSPES